MKNTFLRRISAAFALVGLVAPLFPALAAAPPDSLIKGPDAAVYYLAQDGKRYVFPTFKTYASWYSDFSAVQTISLAELESYPLGGNVTYRGGVRLVKITSDPRVYAVSPGAILRWVETEQLATQLYGANWSTKVDDLPDPFFINYTIGSPIMSTGDYSPSASTASSPTIEVDLQQRKGVIVQTPPPQTGTSTTPTTTSTPSTPPSSASSTDFSFTVSKQELQGGDDVLLTGVSNVAAGISKIELFADGQLVKLCTNQSCTGDFTVPISGTKSQYVFEGRLTKLDNTVETSDLTIPVQSDGSSEVQLRLGQSTITPGELASAIVSINPDVAVYRVDISVGNSIVKSCQDGSRQCSWSDYVQGGIGTTYPVFAKVTDNIGRIFTSDTHTLTIGNNDSPAVTVAPAKTLIYTGETVDITVTASDNDGIASQDVMQGTAVLKHCASPAPCTFTAGPYTSVGDQTFTGRAFDTKDFEGDGAPVTVSVETPPSS